MRLDLSAGEDVLSQIILVRGRVREWVGVDSPGPRATPSAGVRVKARDKTHREQINQFLLNRTSQWARCHYCPRIKVVRWYGVEGVTNARVPF